MVSYPAELKKSFFFFFNDTATTEIYTLSLHDALPIFSAERSHILLVFHKRLGRWLQPGGHIEPDDRDTSEAAAREVEGERSEEPTSELQPQSKIVCRLLPEKTKHHHSERTHTAADSAR